MRPAYLSIIDENQYKKNIDQIINNFRKIEIDNKKLFIVMKYDNKNNLKKSSEIEYIFYDNNSFIQKLISRNIYLKSKNKSYFKKIKRFIILYCSIFIISKLKEFDFIIYLNNNIKLINKINNDTLNFFFKKDSLTSYINRELINYLDDSSLLIINYKNKLYPKYQSYIFKNIINTKFSRSLEVTLDYLNTKIRFYMENNFNANNYNLSSKIKSFEKISSFNFCDKIIISKFIEKDKKNIINTDKIINFKIKKHIERNLDPNFLYQNLELTGLFNKKCNILNVSENKNYLNINFKKNIITDLKTSCFLNHSLNNNFYDVIFFENNIFLFENYIEIILHSKKLSNKIIIRRRFFINELKKKYYINNKTNIIDMLKPHFKKIKILNHIKTDIYILYK